MWKFFSLMMYVNPSFPAQLNEQHILKPHIILANYQSCESVNPLYFQLSTTDHGNERINAVVIPINYQSLNNYIQCSTTDDVDKRIRITTRSATRSSRNLNWG